jgi:hypothetical protein
MAFDPDFRPVCPIQRWVGHFVPARSLKRWAVRYETLTDLLGNCRGREVKPEVEIA